jgi:HAD superfamily hydrolase (TIGR01509 family)
VTDALVTDAPAPPGPILLLDVMDTLVHEPFFVELPAFFGMTLEELLAAKHPTAWIEFEEGRLTEPEYLARFFRDGREVDGAALRAHMSAAYRWLDGVPQLLAELHAAGRPMHALSNYPVWYELIEAKLGLSARVSWSFVSCRTGVRKPDPRAYLGAAEALGVAPADCLFVDDRATNVDGARAVGMPALRFTGAPALGAELVERGLLPG